MDHQPAAYPGPGRRLRAGRSVAVVGAGVAGLAAARRLAAAGVAVTIFEREGRVGGRVFTDTRAHPGFAVDVGAEFIAHFYDQTMRLAGEVGLGGALSPIPSSASIVRGGRPYRLWAGPRVAFTPLLGPRAKLTLSRLVGDVLRHRGALDIGAFHAAHALDTRSVSAYAEAALTPEVLEYLIQPALAGIFYWTPEQTSQAMLLLLVRAAISRPTGMRLISLRGGMGRLPDAMAAGMPVELGAPVGRLEPGPAGGVRLTLTRGDAAEVREFDGAVVATTAGPVADMLGLEGRRRSFFSAVGYSTNITLAVGVRGRLPHEVYSLMVPRRESGLLASATIQSMKNPDQAPGGCDLLTLHMAGPASRERLADDDEAIAEALLAELRRVAPGYDPAGREVFRRVYRWGQALPEFDTGHFGRLRDFAAGHVEEGPVTFAGDYLGGPYVEGALLSGDAAAERLLARLAE